MLARDFGLPAQLLVQHIGIMSEKSSAGSNGGARGGRRVLMPSSTRKPHVVSVSSTHGTERRTIGGREGNGCSDQSAHCHMAGLYDLEETLGKGHFAVVKAAKHVFTGERVRIRIDLLKLSGDESEG